MNYTKMKIRKKYPDILVFLKIPNHAVALIHKNRIKKTPKMLLHLRNLYLKIYHKVPF